MNKNNIALPIRITIYMVTILLFTAGAVFIITSNHFNNQKKQYHEDVLKRKVNAVQLAIDYEIDDFTGIAQQEDVYKILKESFLRIADINKTDIVIYNLQGNKLLTTQPISTTHKILPKNILNELENSNELIIKNKNEEINAYFSYNNIKNYENENIAVLCMPYQSSNDFIQRDMFTLIGNYGLAFCIILIFGTLAVYFVTKKILKKILSFAERIRDTEVISNNITIKYEGNDEIKVLVDSYNIMLQKLKEQSDFITKQEREEAWRDFAKQVAHEIKNPLTPMRLLIQNLLRKFDINDPELEEKTKRTGNILLQQIDTISSIAEIFSDFAKMPPRIDEKINVIDVIKNTLSIFPTKNIELNYYPEVVTMNFDKQYLNRIITNITKNAFQSIPDEREPIVEVDVFIKNESLHINITDNGIGITLKDKESIFAPRFTTKNSGMGIGLSLVKRILDDYEGEIRFESEASKGTTFFITIPYNE